MNARYFGYGNDENTGGTMTDCDTTPTATGTFPTVSTAAAKVLSTGTIRVSAVLIQKILLKVTSTKVGAVSSKVAGALIGVGIVAFLALLALGIMCWRKRRAAKTAAVVASKYDGGGQDRRDFGNRESMEYGIVENEFVEKPRPVYWK